LVLVSFGKVIMKLMMQAEIGHHIQYDYDITVASGGFLAILVVMSSLTYLISKTIIVIFRRNCYRCRLMPLYCVGYHF